MTDTNLSFSELMRGRLMTQTKDVSLSNIEKKQLQYIFKKDFKILNKFKNVNNFQLVDRNFFYDLYKFSYEERTYIIKLGDEDDGFLFKREFEFLERIQDERIAPEPIINGVGEDYSYIITSYEFGLPLKAFGQSTLITNLKPFAKTLKKLHDASPSDQSNFNLFFDYYLGRASFEEILDIDMYQELRSVTGFKTCEKILSKLQELIKIQTSTFIDGDPCLCHTNINESSLLFRNKYFKFINFERSFYLNPLWDVAMTSIKLNLSQYPKLESKFLMHYDPKNYELNCEALPAYKDVAFKLILHDLICTYFYKILIVKEDATLYHMFSLYETIRPMVNHELPIYLETLDKMFGNFEKYI